MTVAVVTDPVEARLRALVGDIQTAARERHQAHQGAWRHRSGMHEASLMLGAVLDELYGPTLNRRERRAAQRVA